MTSDEERPTLSPSTVGQFFRLQSCPMYLQWEYDREAKKEIDKRDWETDSMSPVLADEGDTFEMNQLKRLSSPDRVFSGPKESSLDSLEIELAETWSDDDEKLSRRKVIERAREVSKKGPTEGDEVIHQPWLEGTVGAYDISGKGDLLVLESTSEGVSPTILEVKSSSEQKVHHRYQATIYSILAEQTFRDTDGVELDPRPEGDTYSSVPAKIVTPENSIVSGPDDVEGFSTEPYRAKLELRLEEGGSFDQTILGTEFEGTTNRIARRCSGCEYETFCMTRGLESKGLELLGLQAGTQEALHELGVHSIEDFANLFEQPDNGSVHWDYSPLEPRDEELVERVRQEAEVTNLQKRAQIAYRFLSEIDDNYSPDEYGDFYPHPLRGTGNALPEDEHGEYDVDWEDWGSPDYPSGCLVRVYLYPHLDHAQNRITTLSALVECTFTGESRWITELPNAIPTTEKAKQNEEHRLFSDFFQELADAVEEVSPVWDEHSELSGVNLESTEGFLHIFIYSDDQREGLMEAIRRHPDSGWRRPLRTLLGLRSGIDQNMVSILQDDFRKRWALRFPGLGTVQTTAQFHWDGNWFDWRRPEDSETTLPEIFNSGLFDSAIKYYARDGSIELDHSQRRPSWTPEDMRLAKHHYPVKNRETVQLPVEYTWGVYERLDPGASDDPEDIYPYIYRTDEHSERITQKDIEDISKRFAAASHHIERTIENENRFANDRYINKSPIDIGSLSDFEFEDRTLDEVCLEYQQLEYDTIRTGVEDYYCQPLDERIDSGTSLRFRCTRVDEDSETIEGRLVRSNGEDYDPDVHGGIIGGPLSVTDGDFMVMTRLDMDTGEDERPEQFRLSSPDSIGNSTTVIVSDIDEDSEGTIRINAPYAQGWPYWGEYTVRHRGWSTNPEDIDDTWTTYVEEGTEYVLDPMFDQITQERAHEAIENAEFVPVRRWLRELYQGERETIHVDRWSHAVNGEDRSEGPIPEYLEMMDDAEDFFSPNPDQKELIKDVDHGIVTLQGPPGTGKTEYTLAPAVLSRVHSDISKGLPFRGVVSALSHTAVDEALESIAELQDACPPGGDVSSVDLIRICSSRGQGIDHSRVDTVHYNEAGASKLEEIYTEYISPESPDENRVLFFGPPVSIRSWINAMIREVDDFDYENIADLMSEGDSPIFDLGIIDEASMMDLPLCLLLGSFIREPGQLFLVGDHRQMQPIQKHEWEDEDREPIEKHRPFLSALDFLRYLRGEPDVELEYVERQPPELEDPDEALPVHRLEETYRLPEESAAMHTDLFYRQDDIELISRSEEYELPDTTGNMSEILDTSDRITLLVHDENQSQKTNEVEQALIAELLRPFDIREGDRDEEMSEDDITAGVVVPFRAQRRDVVGMVGNTEVDTVERFQGGERDLMVLSMTASDRGYINQISDFLLEPNRFNVGASRMKRKLVVIASSGVFEESSDDVTTFEDQKSWISFYQNMGNREDDYEERDLVEMVTEETYGRFLEDVPNAEDIQVKIYSGYEYDD